MSRNLYEHELAMENQIDPFDASMSKDMADTLMTTYPGYAWGVRVESKHGMAYIYCLDVSGNRAYAEPLGAIYSASEWRRRVIDRAGLILEIFGLRRGAANMDEIMRLETNLKGQVIAADGQACTGVLR